MGKPVNLLIVEDSKDDALLLIRTLKNAGYEVSFERVDTKEAMQAALDNKAWDIVICDYVMPNFDGLGALKLLRKKGIDIPLILVSGKIGEEKAVEVMKAGANDYIMKDNLARLALAVEREIREAKIRRDNKCMNELFKENEARFKNVVESAADAIILLDNSGKIILWNKGAQNVFLYTEGDILGQPVSILIPERYREAHLKGIMAASSGKYNIIGKVVELHGRRKDGTEFPLEFSLAAWDTEKGKIFSSIIHDITERKHAEEALRESEERHRTLVNYSPYGITIHCDGKISFMNITGTNILGSSSPDYFIGKNLFDIIHPDYHGIVREHIRIQDMGKVALPMEEVFIKADGTFVDVELTSIPFNYKGKQVNYGVFSDITERKRNKEKLHEEHERFHTVFDEGPFGMAIVSLEYRFIRINKKLCQMLGYTEQELNKHTFIDITDPDDVSKNIQFVQQLERGNIPYFKTDKRYIMKNGDFLWASLTASLIRDNDKKPLYYLAIIEDITERRKGEEIGLKNIRLEEADKAKSEFFANMSHELRTPLNASIGFSELLTMGMAGELNEKQKHYVNNILTSNQFLLSLINDILDLSKIEAGKIELVFDKMSLHVTIKETLSLIKENALKHNVLLKTELDPELEFIEADRQRFKQILFNLLSNAIKFSKEEGGIITIITKKEGDMAKISVSDTGIGIKEENIGKLFQKFEQLESGISQKYGGTGLGLAITKQLVEQHGGRIWVKSKYGEGSTFTFTLPLAAKKQEL